MLSAFLETARSSRQCQGGFISSKKPSYVIKDGKRIPLVQSREDKFAEALRQSAKMEDGGETFRQVSAIRNQEMAEAAEKNRLELARQAEVIKRERDTKWRNEHPFESAMLDVAAGPASYINKHIYTPIVNTVGNIVGLFNKDTGDKIKMSASDTQKYLERLSDKDARELGEAITGAVTDKTPAGKAVQGLEQGSDIVSGLTGGEREPLTLHAVIVKKPIDKSEAMKKAQKISRKRRKLFVRETGESYRFRIVPKTKFSSFVSKPIDDNITLVLGTLKQKV